MKKFIIASVVAVVVAAFCVYAYAFLGWRIDFSGQQQVSAKATQEGKTIYLDTGSGPESFEIRGVDLGCGIPGYYATDYAIDEDTYLRWFEEIKALGANCIRVYILQNQAFYDAVYEFNKDNPDPLYVIHGVWIDDYTQNSHLNAYDSEYLDQFKEDTQTMIDVIHGQRPFGVELNSSLGVYAHDISPWVIGYILGVEWEAPTVEYTDMTKGDKAGYSGKYLYTTDEATPFESMLAQVGDYALSYESDRYHEQRLLAFSNWPTTDPFDYPDNLANYFEKYESVDVKHIQASDQVVSGMFVSYHVYPYYPDYLNNMDIGDGELEDVDGDKNTYYAYLRELNEYYDLPLVISEYGVPSARGSAQPDANTGRSQGAMSETDQGEAIVECYRDIMNAGCAGSVVFSWQDEWFKRTWNTMANVDLTKTPYWSDYQTNEQYFGLLSFDPGTDRCVSYVDGDDEEWTNADVVCEQDDRTVSMKYDEKFVYLMVRGQDVSPETNLYVPIDTTQKTGSSTCDDPDLLFDRGVDFVIELAGEDESRVVVQKRYDVFRATMLQSATGEDPYVDVPAKDTSEFVTINLLLQTLVGDLHPSDSADQDYLYVHYETGKLTYGNANPASADYNSLADFCYGDGFVEVKLPWQLLNFANPSEMMIHDDYYENYGIDYLSIDGLYVGVGDGSHTAESGDPIDLSWSKLQGWGSTVTYHERLKPSYYILRDYWKALDSGDLTLLDDVTKGSTTSGASESVEVAEASDETAGAVDGL